MILEGLLYHLTRDLPTHTRGVAEGIAEKRSHDFTDNGWYVAVRHPVISDAWYVKHYDDRLKPVENL